MWFEESAAPRILFAQKIEPKSSHTGEGFGRQPKIKQTGDDGMKEKNNYRTLILAASLISLLWNLMVASQVSSFDFIDWEKGKAGYELAVLDAERDGQPVVLYFYLSKSKWCEKMNKDYLADLEIEEFLSHVFKAAVNPDESEEDASLAEAFKIKEYPAFLVLVPPYDNIKPERIHPFSRKGDMTPDEFLKILKGIITTYYNKNAFSYFEKKDYQNAIKYFGVSLTFDPEQAYNYHALGIIYETIGLDKKDDEILEKAIGYFQKALKIDPDNKESKAELKKLQK